MWANIISNKNNARCIAQSNENSSLSLILKAAIVILILSFLPLLAGAAYSDTTKKCISCHNDTGYPADSDMDGVAAPYKRPHNNNTMCESCHEADPHIIKFIQPDGTYAGKSTAASCPACHQTIIPNVNFTLAFQIPATLRHSSDPLNGSVWGPYWSNSNPKEACIYCHNITLHNILPLGRILEWAPGYIIDGPIGSNFSCANCHYKGSADYSAMIASFTAASLPTPPEITNGTSWNGTSTRYFNHSIRDYTDNGCVPCHGNSLAPGARMSEFLHNVNYADMNNCLGCHRSGSSAPEVNANDLGSHIDLNLTNGAGNLTSEDCRTCHFTDPHKGANVSNTYYCYDCHNKSVGGRAPIRSSKKFDDKKHGEVTCINCHVADGRYHQGNPRGSVANSSYIGRFVSTITNTTDCADCHRAANLDDAPFNAPGGGTHIDNSCSSGGGCHGGSTFIAAVHTTTPLDNLQKKPIISVPTLDYSTVTQGTDVNIAAIASLTPPNGNALVDGAQYRINNSDNTQTILPWTPMAASDGNFDSLSEGVAARINTNNLTGTYNIFVRGMGGGPSQNPLERYYPMNGDISPVKSVTLVVQPLGGFINGTITSGGSALEGALVSTTSASDITGPDGTYSLSVPPDTYTVTVSMEPTHDSSTTSNVVVTALNTSYANMTLSLRPTGTISGTITN
ncbi:MAG: hypothetical protein C3F06_00035 [Candidatus Methanoperedenaceae archaeon]|nr:MAG: hypothetical protein C3F06_00035 [Candidatus Methanoperedenaceae archaeon]